MASGGALLAQTAHPFAPPEITTCFSLTSTVGMVDVNRDGSVDMISPALFFGMRVTTLDEDGVALATDGPGPGLTTNPLSPTIGVAIALAGGDMDGDGLDDLMSVSTSGSVHFHRNLGSTAIHTSRFAIDVVIDDFLAAFPINPPFINYVFPCAEVADFDGDGFADLLIAGGPVDRWNGTTAPGFVGFYKGDGAGGFQAHRFQLAGSAIDMEFADLDNDQTRDCLVVLTETGGVGAFTNDVLHLAFMNGNLVALGYPQNVGPGRLTALEVADVIGDGNSDYILAHTPSDVSTAPCQVYCMQGDGQGNVLYSGWSTLGLPANVTGIGEFIASIQVGDFNRDQQSDIAVLRGFVQPPQTPMAQAVLADAEILIALGPQLAYASFETIPLPGHVLFSSVESQLFSLLPLSAQPDYLRTIDLGGDSSTDLMVPGLRSSGASSPPQIVTLKNSTSPTLGDARFEKVGDPSGGVAAWPARIGFEGGRPRPGTPGFACTIQNVQGGCVVGLMWSSYGQADLFSAYGLQFHIAPAEFGYAALTSGSLPGQGFYSYPLPIPNQPTLIGDMGYFQYNYYDHVAGVFGGTQATGLWIGH